MFRIVHRSDWIHLYQVSAQTRHLGSILDQVPIVGVSVPCTGLNLNPAWILIWTLHLSQSGHCMGLNLDPAWVSMWTLHGPQSGYCCRPDPVWGQPEPFMGLDWIPDLSMDLNLNWI